MVCYLCHDYTYEPLVNCGNILCQIYFHKSCWKKYLKKNNFEKSICKVCYIGKINIYNPINNGEVQICCCAKLFKK